MRNDENFKLVRMIPAPRMVTANGVSASAATYGSGGQGVKGICDTFGYRRVRIHIAKSAGTAQKLSTLKFGFQSGAASLFASCTTLSGFTSGILASAITTSAWSKLIDIDLTNYAGRKRYLNAKLTTCTTSGTIEVSAYLTNAEQFPPSTTGYTVTQRYV